MPLSRIGKADRPSHSGDVSSPREEAIYQNSFMDRAIALSKTALTSPGTEPFGAVVVKDGVIVGEGLNQSLKAFDPTSHGETEAIRDACRTLQCVDLSGCELYSSCEPCAMCVATMEIAGIAKLYYAASMKDAGSVLGSLPKAKRHPIDAERLLAQCGLPAQERDMPSEQQMREPAVAILEEWATALRGA